MAGMDVNARLTLDASGFIGPMTQAQTQAQATARATAKAARDSANAQAAAARYAGDAVTEQTRKQLAASKQAVQASREYTQVQGFIRRGTLQGAEATNAEAAALQRKIQAQLASAAASRVQEHAEVSQRMAASAAVRGLRDGNVGIRSVENFITTVPGVGAALQSIFPALGGVAFVAMLGEMVAKLVEAKKEADLLARKISDGFRDEHLSVAMSTDELRLHNDQLQNEIDKLEHKPQNNLLIELDANVLAVDRLAKGAIEAQKRVKELLQENKVGQLAQFMGHDSTAVVAGSVNAYRQDIADLAFQKSEQTRANNKAGAEETQRLLDAKKASYAKWLSDQIEMRTGTVAGTAGQTGRNAYSLIHGTQAENLAILRGERIDLRDEADAEVQASRTGPLENRKTGLESAKTAGEQQKKADELRLKQMEADLAALHLLHSRTIKEDEQFWDARRNVFAVGSAQYNTIIEKQAQLAEESVNRVHELVNKAKEEQRRSNREEMPDLDKGMRSWHLDDARALQERIDASNEANAQEARNTARKAELLIQQAAGRTMTQTAAATELAAIHTREYGAELDRLLAKQKAIRESKAEDGHEAEREKQLADLKKQITQTRADRTVQVLTDQYNINQPDSSALVGAKDALAEFTRQALDSASQMKSLVTGILNDVNKTLVEELTSRSRRGPRHLWTNLGKETATHVASAALERGESVLLKGFIAPKGTPNDPLHVILHGLAGAATAVGGAIAGAAGAAKSTAGSWISKLLPFIPGFADGVSAFGGGWAMVGERGPELLKLPGGSSVVPNHRLPSVMDSRMHFSPTIHVTGNADPAQMMAYVHAGLKQAMPVYLHAARADQADRKRRKTGRA